LKTFQSALTSGAFTITAELPWKGQTETADAIRLATTLSEHVDGIQLGDNPPGRAGPSPTALSALLLREGTDVTPTINCRDRNRIALQSELLGLRAIGVTSLVLNRGSGIPAQQQKPAGAVFDFNGRELIAAAREIEENDWAIGTDACVPTGDSDWDAAPLIDRAAAGARFLRLRPCFDMDLLRRHIGKLVEDKVTWHFSVIVSLAPLPSDDADDPEQEGTPICAQMIREVAAIPGVSGINLVCLDNPDSVIAALQSSGVRQEA